MMRLEAMIQNNRCDGNEPDMGFFSGWENLSQDYSERTMMIWVGDRARDRRVHHVMLNIVRHDSGGINVLPTAPAHDPSHCHPSPLCLLHTHRFGLTARRHKFSVFFCCCRCIQVLCRCRSAYISGKKSHNSREEKKMRILQFRWANRHWCTYVRTTMSVHWRVGILAYHEWGER